VPDTPAVPGEAAAPAETVAGLRAANARLRELLAERDGLISFVFAVLGATSETANSATAGIVVGLSLTVVHLLGIPVTGTSVNPARSLGPALILGGTALSQVWLFIVAPLLGGTITAAVHLKLYRRPGQEVLEVGQAS
jgi:aquaporin Z